MDKKKKIAHSKNELLTESEYNKLIDNTVNDKIEIFKSNFRKSKKPREYVKHFKTQIDNELYPKKGQELMKMLKGKTALEAPAEFVLPFDMIIALGTVQNKGNEYQSLISYCKDNKIENATSFIKEYARKTALGYALEEIDVIYRDYYLHDYDSINEHDINTKVIYHGLQDNERWKDFSRDFLINDVQEKLQEALYNTIPLRVSIDYLERHKNELERCKQEDNFPFPRFYVKKLYRRNKNLCGIINYGEQYAIVQYEDVNFDFLFALQFYVMNVMKTDDYLNFHLKKSFANNHVKFRLYLEKLHLGHEFLPHKYERLITLYIGNYLLNENIQSPTESVPVIDVNKLIKGNETIRETVPHKPYFKSQIIDDLANKLNDYFKGEEIELLELLRGNTIKKPITFIGSGNKLGDVFKKLFEAGYIIHCTKKQLQIWIAEHFRYSFRQEIKLFTPEYLEKCISRKDHPCKNPILEIKGGKIILGYQKSCAVYVLLHILFVTA